jgi:hypothetical protein
LTHRRIILLFLAFLAVLSGSTYYFLFRAGAATSFIQDLIGKSIHRRLFELESAEIDFAEGRLTLHGFQLSNPTAGGQLSKLLSVRRVNVDVETNPTGELGTIRQVELHGLEAHVSLDKDQAPDFGQIFRQAKLASSGTREMATPVITVTDSRIRLRAVPDRPSILFEGLALRIRPVSNRPGIVQMTGSMRSPRGHKITIQGDGDLGSQNFRTVLTVEEFPIIAEQAAVFQAGAQRFLDAAKVKGRIKNAKVWVDYQNHREGTPLHSGASLEFHDLDMALPQLPYPITKASGKVFAESQNGGKVRFEFRHQSPTGNITATGKLSQPLEATRYLDVQVGLEDIAINEVLLAAIDKGKVKSLRDIKAAFEPVGGRINAEVHLSNKAPASRLQASANATFEGLRTSFQGFPNSSGKTIGFPYPMQNVAGKVAIRPGSVSIESMTATDSKGAKISMQGTVTGLGKGVPPTIALDIDGRGLAFSESLKQALRHSANNAVLIYEDYAPSGEADLNVELRGAGKDLQYSIQLLPKSAAIQYAKFPLPVEDVTGALTITKGHTQLDLHGTHGDAKISAKGRFLSSQASASSGSQSKLSIQTSGLSFSPRVYQAANTFDSAVGDLWRDLNPTGTFDSQINLWRKPEEADFHYDAQLHLRDTSVAFAPIPLPFESLTGDLFFHGVGTTFRCDISPIRAHIPNGSEQAPAALLIQGSILGIGATLSADVTAVIKRLRLTDQLGKALQKAGAVTEQLWDSLGIDGFADVTARIERKKGQRNTSKQFDIELRDVSSNAPAIPGKARGLHGKLHVDGDRAWFTSIEGMIDETKISIRDGEIKRQNGQTTVGFTVSADSFPIDKRLANALHGPARKAYLDRQFSGQVNLDQVQIMLRVPDQGTSVESEFQGKIEAKDLFMDVGIPGSQSLKHLTGTLTITKGFANTKTARMSGTVSNARFELSNHQIHHINSKFTINPSRLVLNELTFQTAGGTIRGGSSPESPSFEYRFTERGKIFAYLNYEDLRLRELLKDEALAHSKVRGTCFGQVIIHELTGGDFLDMRARGYIGVHDGRLGTVPLFSAIYKHIREDKRPQFTKGRAEFTVKEGKILLQKFNVRSNLIKVEGQGSLNMDGYMDINLNVPRVFGSTTNILILPPLLNQVFAKIVRFKVYGYIRNPKIEHLMPFSKGFARQSLAPIPPVPVASKPSKSPK